MPISSSMGAPGELEARGGAWTAREIAQQPSVWADVASLVAGRRASFDAFLTPLLAKRDLRILLSGAGTSGFIGECLAPALAAHLKRRVDAVSTTDIVSGPHLRLHGDGPILLISFARSGGSPESVASVDLAEQLLPDVHHLIVTCNASGALAKRAVTLRSAQLLVLPDATNDRGFAMTSSFTAMLLSAGLLFGVIRESCVPQLCHTAQSLLPQLWPLAQSLVDKKFERVVYLGSNELRALAAEAALKLLELSDGQIVAMSESPLGFRHGPKTIINGATLVVLMLSNDPHTRRYDLDLLAELQRDARAGGILAVDAQDRDMNGIDRLLLSDVSDARDLELALLHVLFAQTYALLQSLACGLTPDRPNAAGIVSRVVQGVTIYPVR